MISPSIRLYVLIVTIALAAFTLAYRQGSYGALQTAEAAATACLGVCVLVAVGVRPRQPTAFLAFGGLLVAFAAWTALSLLWAPSADNVVPQLVLVSFYLGVFAVVALAVRNATLPTWCDGLAIGVAAIGCVALLSRFFPDLFGAARTQVRLLPGSSSRLAFPIGYWNGLGLLIACSVALFLRSAVGGRDFVRTALSAGFLPAAGTIIFLASSRGAALVAVASICVYVVLSGSRWPSAVGAAALGGAGSATAIAVVKLEPALVDRPFSAAAENAGGSTFVGTAAVCVATGIAFALADRLLVARWHPSRRAAAIAASAAVVAAVAALAVADLPARFDSFTSVPTAAELGDGTSVESHLLSGSSTGRWQLWTAAIREFETHPAQGRGAGTYEGWWAQHGTLPIPVRNAHSLYFETLAELGIVGFLILAALVLGGLTFGVRTVLQTESSRRHDLAAPLAVFAAFALAAAIDWVWQLPAVGVLGIAALGMLAGAAPKDEEAEPGHRVTRAAAIASLAVTLPLFAFATIEAAAQLRLGESERAAARGDGRAAVSDAQAARALQPWSAQPLLRLALVEERFGSLDTARLAIGAAVRKNSTDWRLRIIAARLAAKTGHVAEASRQLAVARSLNPRSPLFTSSK